MSYETMQPTFVRTLGALTPDERRHAGGKGAALARLYQAGYAVPDGFLILPAAFDGDGLLPEAWTQVQAQLARMRQASPEVSFAVRSSALSEDSAFASFAGEFETVLDVHSDERVQAAIETVRHSRHAERVLAYSEAKGIDPVHDMAVVVQQLVRAEISGVLFTADPVTGNRQQMVGNFVYGFGEELVSGESEPYAFTLERPTALWGRPRYQGPYGLKRFAGDLFKLGRRLEGRFGHPQDIEWSITDADGPRAKLHLLQSRPITTLVGYDPVTEERNDTLTGDYLWTNTITAEVFPRAATPSTRSIWQIIFDRLAMGEAHPSIGWIAGRPYLNYSLMYAFLTKIVRDQRKAVDMLKDTVALPPQGTEIPPYPLPIRTILFGTLPREVGNELQKRKLQRNRVALLAAIPERCEQLRRAIQNAKRDQLIELWLEQVKPTFVELFVLQDSYNERFATQSQALRSKLRGLLGEEEANLLLSTAVGGSQDLASVGPVVGLDRLKRGEISREAYLEQYGHRAPYENYLSIPRPYEEPERLDDELEAFDGSIVDVSSRLAKRGAEFGHVWDRLKEQLPPRRQAGIRRELDATIEACIAREATRSELARATGMIRALLLRAGECTGLGNDIFYLRIDETIALLSGQAVPTEAIPARREAYARYSDLPAPPTWIRGRFDPFQWVSDPDRRVDIYDPGSATSAVDTGEVVTGNPGSSGRAEGLVRRIDHPDQGRQLQPGEILVTNTTNIGWTPLFPRAAAIVTDIGGALSHAAIVAREIGIPAVVGCGNATMRLRTGDRVCVNGGQGIVEILERGAVPPTTGAPHSVRLGK
jgi:phosphohistidine swiveling domain-containing protein